MGLDRYSRPSLNGLDRKLERYLDFDGGFFVEAGANDGFTQSNTYYFERLRGWRGMLIEPIPELYERCRRLRRRSVVVQSALIAPDSGCDSIEMQFAGLMSFTTDSFGDENKRREHLSDAAKVRQLDDRGSYKLSVPAATLSQIIDRVAPNQSIDLLSLDVEGAELLALAGLDTKRHSPLYICVEARDPNAVCLMLQRSHVLVEVLTSNSAYQDLLFRRR